MVNNLRPVSSLRHIQFLSQNRPGALMGMGQYERLLFTHLGLHAAQTCEFGITFSGRAPEQALPLNTIGLEKVDATFLGVSMERLFALPWPLAQMAVRYCLRNIRPSLYHSLTAGFPAPNAGNAPAIYSVLDLAPVQFEDEGRIPPWTKQALQNASLIITPSHFSSEELKNVFGIAPEKLRTVYLGCEHEIFRPEAAPADPEQLAGIGIHGPYLIYSGGSTRRKNVKALLQAWHQIAREYTDVSLVLTGPPEVLGEYVRQANAPRVVIAGYLERPVLCAVMKASVALVFPSIYEGFGLPPLEAMALGVPVVAVRAGATPEVVGDCASLAQSGEPEALVAAMRHALDDRSAREERVRRGLERAQQFSWSAHAEEILGIYNEVLAG